MEKYLKRLFKTDGDTIEVNCRIKDLVEKKGQKQMNLTMTKNYGGIIANCRHLEALFDSQTNVGQLWQAEEMLQQAVVGSPSTVAQTAGMLEKVLKAKNFGEASDAVKANELVKTLSEGQAAILVWAYIGAQSNVLINQNLIDDFVKNAKVIRGRWLFHAFISEEDFARISMYGSACDRSLKNPGRPTLMDMIVAPVMNSQQNKPFDVHGFFEAFPEFKTLERNPAWGKYGGYALEAVCQIVYGPIRLAAQAILETNLRK